MFLIVIIAVTHGLPRELICSHLPSRYCISNDKYWKMAKKAKTNYIEEEKITAKGKYGVLSLHTSIVRAWPSSYTPIRVAAKVRLLPIFWAKCRQRNTQF